MGIVDSANFTGGKTRPTDLRSIASKSDFFVPSASGSHQPRSSYRPEAPARARPLRHAGLPDEPVLRGGSEPHFQRVLDAIAGYDRKFVLFCGAVFEKLLEQSDYELEWDHHDFHLPLVNGGLSKNLYRFSNVLIDYQGGTVRAGVARSFAIQGIPMDLYGERCHQLYNAWGQE
jgi:hypothetical protein